MGKKNKLKIKIMTKEFNQAIVSDLGDRFGEEVAERFKGKELVNSVRDFYLTGENYLKHTKGISLGLPVLGESLGDLNINDIANQISDSIMGNKPLLFVVGNNKEQDVLEVMLRSMKSMLGDYGEQVSVIRAKDAASSVNQIKAFSKEMAMEDDDEFNVISIGAGFNNGFVDTYTNRKSIGATSAKFSYIDTGIPDSERKTKHGISTMLKTGVEVSLSEVLSRSIVDAMATISQDNEYDALFIPTYVKTAKRLAKFGNQVSAVNVPLEFRTSDRSELSLFTSLSSKYQFFRSIDWCRQLAVDAIGDAEKEVIGKALYESGIDRAKFFMLVDAIAQANVKAGVINKALRKRLGSDADALEGNYDLANEINHLTPTEYSKLHGKDNLHEMKINIMSLESKDLLTEAETEYLSLMKNHTISLRKTNRALRGLLKNSDFIKSEMNGSTNLCFFKSELFKHIDRNYLRSLVSTPLDGSVILAPDEPSQSITASFYASAAIKRDLAEYCNDKKNISVVGNTIKIEGLWGQDVTKDELVGLSGNIENISKKIAAAKAVDEAPVIVAEPDSLGKALAVMNYINAGHSNGIDANIHFRIPRKEKLRVTHDSGKVEYMTVDEVATSKNNFATIECLYKAEKTENYDGVKSVYISKEDLVSMHSDLGKKRFYGPLKTKFSAKGDSGDLHVVGYDANFSIRYRKDIVLKAEAQRKNVISDSFWKEMNRKGNVQRIKNENNIKDVNGVNVDADNNFATFKNTVLATLDRMNGAVDVNGECAYWCCDTETTGLDESDDLINFGGSAYSVVKGSGTIVDSDMVFTALDGNKYVVSGDGDVIDLTDAAAAKLPLSELTQFPDGTFFRLNNAEPVDNVADLGNGNSVINRKIKQTYVSALVKELADRKVPNEIEKLTGLSNEQVSKYGLSVNELEKVFEKEAGAFKKNCFTFHNSSFDSNVLAVNTLGVANTMISGGNFVADTLSFSKESRPTAQKKDVYSIKFGASGDIQFTDKAKVIEFLKTGKDGDELQCMKGSLLLSEDKKGNLRLRLVNGSKGVFHKGFDPDVRNESIFEPMIEERTAELCPSINVGRKRMLFENNKLLNKFIAGGSEGDKFRAMGGGYLQVFDGAIYAYPNGIATSAKKICSVGDTGVSKFTDKAILCNKMDHFVGLQKVSDILNVAFPVKHLLPDEVSKIIGLEAGAQALTMARTFEQSYDHAKTLLENKRNFEVVYGDQFLSSMQLENIAASSIANNKERVFGLRNMDAIKAVAPLIEGGSYKRGDIEDAAKKTGVPTSVALLASKALFVAKKQTKIKEIFLNQSHNNASRFNSDACIELPVATTTLVRSNGNSYDKASAITGFVDGMGKSALKATHDASYFVTKIPTISKTTEQALGMFSKRGGTLAKLGTSNFASFNFGANGGKAVYTTHSIMNNSKVSDIREINGLISGFSKLKAGKTPDNDPLGVFVKDSFIGKNINNIEMSVQNAMDDAWLSYAGFSTQFIDEDLVRKNVKSLFSSRDKLNLDGHGAISEDVLQDGIVYSYAKQLDALSSASALLPSEDKIRLMSRIEDLKTSVGKIEVLDPQHEKTLEFGSVSIDSDVPNITSSEIGAMNDAALNIIANSNGFTLHNVEFKKDSNEYNYQNDVGAEFVYQPQEEDKKNNIKINI
ncbi:hypothetical protein [Photobacterium kishitanii]|uniref:Uncharacterized protein n=1 Tax=Photobacterium kishitanii TaxID=318456 RepID=A0A2T3KLY4_9GAMM|nr:hypothetical protein [Photobacterium kishitanii]PSV00701.1 hypothetical protein C9J27_06050 [Photobacterium kishitanii]